MPETREDPTDMFPFPTFVTTDIMPVMNGSTAVCVGDKALAGNLETAVLCSAGMIIVILNILIPRWKGKSLQSWLEIVVPVKFLDSSPFRLVYCMVMSAWAGDVLKQVSNTSKFFRSKDQAVLDAFQFFVLSPSVIILKQALSYFPVLACVDGPLPWLAHTLGFLHTLLLGANSVLSEAMELQGCSPKGHMTTRDMVFSVVVSAPVYVIYLVTAGWFLFHALLELPLVLFTRHKCRENIVSLYDTHRPYFQYVRGLFRRCLRPHRYLNIHTLWSYLKRGLAILLPYTEGFSYPLPFLSALCMGLLLIYQLGLSLSYAAVSFTEKLMVDIREFNITVDFIDSHFPSLKTRVDNLFYDAKSFVLAFNILIPLSTFIGFALSAMFMLYMAQHFHKLMVKASQGDLSYLVKSEPLPSVPYRLAATMRYTAFQVSYIVFTWFVFTLMMTAIMTFGMLFYFLFKNFQHLGVHLWSWVMIPLMWSTVMHQTQVFLCHFVFLNDKKASKTGFVPLRFKSAYQVLSYFFFFFNVIYGIVMCFLRIYGVVIFTAVMLARMDWDVYMRGLEGWDVGSRTFVGYFYMECTNNNPIVRTFIALLQDTVTNKPTVGMYLNDASVESDVSDVSSHSNGSLGNGVIQRHPVNIENASLPHRRTSLGLGSRGKGLVRSVRIPRSRQARNRWLVAYTLLRNPSLRTYTASSLRQFASTETNISSQYGTF